MADERKLYELRNAYRVAYHRLSLIDAESADAVYRRFGHWDDLDLTGLLAALDAVDTLTIQSI